jgi:hypothetical protein
VTPTPLATFDARWLMEQEFPSIRYVVQGLIPEGMTLLVAAPKIGKSWLVLGLALQLSTGRPAFGGIPTGGPRPVLYLALEDGPRRLQSRIRTIGDDFASPKLHFITSLAEGTAVDVIKAFLSKHDGHDPVVILDTLGKVMPSNSTTKTQYAADYDFLGSLKATADAVPGSSLVIVHHTRKMGGDDFLDAVSGTQGIAGAADTVLVLRRERQDPIATLYVTSRDAHEGEYAMTLSKNGVWTMNGGSLKQASQAAQLNRTTAGVGDRMAEVISAVSEHPDGVAVKDLKSLLADIPPAQVDKYLSRAVEAGRLEKLTRGVYIPVRSVRSVSSEEGTDTNDTSDTLITDRSAA